MKNDERTENLLESNKKPKHKGLRIVLITLLVLLVVAVFLTTSYFFYKTYKENENKKKNFLSLSSISSASSGLTYDNLSNPENLTEDVLQDKVKTSLENDNYLSAEEAYIQLYNLTQDPTYLDLSEEVISGNTTGNLGNIGKILQDDSAVYISTLKNNTNYLWKLQNNEANIIYQVENESFGINDLQYWKGSIYMKSAGHYGRLDLSNNQYTDIDLIPKNTIPISPRIYNGNLYYLANDPQKGVNIYRANLDGSEAEELINIGSTISVENIAAFTIIYRKAYLFYTYSDSSDGSEIFSFSLTTGDEEELYSTDGYIQPYITYANGGIYFIENPSSDSNKNNSVYRINLGNNNIKDVIDSASTGISTINSKDSNLYYIEDNKIYSCTLEGKDSKELSEPPANAATLSGIMYPRLLLTTKNKLFSEFRGMLNQNRETMVFEQNYGQEDIDFHKVELN